MYENQIVGKHVDLLRPYDQPYIRVTDDWAYGERAYWRIAEKFDAMLREAAYENAIWHPFI